MTREDIKTILIEDILPSVGDCLNSKDIKEMDNLMDDISFDSLDIMDMVLRIEHKFSISIDDNVVSKDIHTVEDVINTIYKLKNN